MGAIASAKDFECQWCGKAHLGICDEAMAVAAAHVVQHPGLDNLHSTYLANMTVRPTPSRTAITLMWMQLEPSKWQGLAPQECERVARAFHLLEA